MIYFFFGLKIKLSIQNLTIYDNTHTYMNTFRCCAPIAMDPCYASILYSDDINAEVVKVEKHGLVPCVTGWCSKHHKVALLHNQACSEFPTQSAYITHVLATSKRYLKH